MAMAISGFDVRESEVRRSETLQTQGLRPGSTRFVTCPVPDLEGEVLAGGDDPAPVGADRKPHDHPVEGEAQRPGFPEGPAGPKPQGRTRVGPAPGPRAVEQVGDWLVVP